MTITDDDLLEKVQEAAYAVCRAMPRLAEVRVISDDEGDIQSRVLRALQTLDAQDGKIGLAVVITRPEVAEAELNLPGPVLTIKQEVLVIEHVTLNRGATGTGIRASRAALAIAAALHHHNIGGHVLYCGKDAVTVQPNMKQGFTGHIVTVTLGSAGYGGPEKVSQVIADFTVLDEVELSCGTAEAVIYYTLDGSYPSPWNAVAAVYSAALDLEDGTLVRAAAYKAGMNPGDCLEFRLSAG